MTPRSDELSVVSPLVASCPTFKEATRTVDYLCDLGVPRRTLSVVAEGLRPPSEGSDGSVMRPGARAWRGWVAGAVVGVVAGLSVGGPIVGTGVAVLCGLCGGVATAICSGTSRWRPSAADRELVTADRYYVISDQATAREARLLLRGGADARAPSFEMHATPCVGFLPVRRRRPSNGEVTAGRWRAWVHRHPGTA